jgi:hypothetical protein
MSEVAEISVDLERKCGMCTNTPLFFFLLASTMDGLMSLKQFYVLHASRYVIRRFS